MNDEYMSSTDIKEKIEELKIRLAFQMEFEEEFEEVLAECEKPDRRIEKLIEDNEERILRDISIRAKKAGRLQKQRKALVCFGRLCAVLVVVLSLCFGSALATIRMVEIGLLELDIREHEQGTSYGLRDTGKAIEVPVEWKGDFYVSYIPDEYEFSHVDRAGAWYVTVDGRELNFDENSEYARRSVDTEDANISNVLLNGVEAMVTEKDGLVTVVWAENGRWFVVEMEDYREIALQIAASLVLVK